MRELNSHDSFPLSLSVLPRMTRRGSGLGRIMGIGWVSAVATLRGSPAG
jgi:hypothetical protein